MFSFLLFFGVTVLAAEHLAVGTARASPQFLRASRRPAQTRRADSLHTSGTLPPAARPYAWEDDHEALINFDGTPEHGDVVWRRRSLLNGCHFQKCAPLCPICKVPREENTGHCQSNGRLYTCKVNWENEQATLENTLPNGDKEYSGAMWDENTPYILSPGKPPLPQSEHDEHTPYSGGPEEGEGEGADE